MTGGTAARTPNDGHVVQNKQQDKDVTDQRTTPGKPVFDNDYKFTQEDLDASVFIRKSYSELDVVDVGDTVLKVHHLKPNVNKGFIFDEVSPLYCNLPELFQPMSC